MGTRMTNGFFELYAEDLLSLTREQFNDFREADMVRMMEKPSSPPPAPTTPVTTLSGYTKGTVTSESQVALNKFRKGTKRDASAYPNCMNDLYYYTFWRAFLATIKAQGLCDVADPDFDPGDGDQYDHLLFEEKQSLVYSVLVTSVQTDKGRELVKELEGDARTIISKLHHYHTQSNVAQHEVVTLTTYITSLNLTDSWKGTTSNFSVTSRRISDCLIALSLILTRFQKV